MCVGPRSAVFAPDRAARPDRRGRGARRLLQARGRPPLRRARGRGAARARRRRAAAAGQRHPAPGERAAGVADPHVAAAPVHAGRRSSAAARERARHARRRRDTGLHPETARALAQVRERRGKAIVLLNRRGWSNFLSCRSCGRVWSCPQCDVALVLHRHGGFLACHHCGHREPAPQRCGQCGSISVARHGAGTERVQHDLTTTLGGEDDRFPVLRLDADTVSGRARPGGRDAAAPVRGGRVGRPDRHADGRQGSRLPGRDARGRARRRRDPALPRLPRRGAHVRADRPARRACRSWRGGSRARADASLPRPARSRMRPGTTATGFWRASWSAGGRCATRRSRT